MSLRLLSYSSVKKNMSYHDATWLFCFPNSIRHCLSFSFIPIFCRKTFGILLPKREKNVLQVSWFRNVFLVSSLSSKKRTKSSQQVVKSNLFVHFLEETSAWKNHFEFVWPLKSCIYFLDLMHFHLWSWPNMIEVIRRLRLHACAFWRVNRWPNYCSENMYVHSFFVCNRTAYFFYFW